MASNNPLIKAVKGPVIDVIENSRKRIPAALTGSVTSAAVWLPTTVPGATQAFQRTYTDMTTRVVAWLPTTIPALTKLLNGLADKAVAAVKAA